MIAVYRLGIIDCSIGARQEELICAAGDGGIAERAGEYVAHACGKGVVSGEIKLLSEFGVRSDGVDAYGLSSDALPIIVRRIATGAGNDILAGARGRSITADHPFVVALVRVFREEGYL